MKRFAFAFALLGCSAGAPVVEDPGPNAPAPRMPTEFPTGNPDGDPAHAPYPIVLAHGLDGFDNIGPINYFYGVADALRKDGHQVFTAQVDAYNSSDVRGAQ